MQRTGDAAIHLVDGAGKDAGTDPGAYPAAPREETRDKKKSTRCGEGDRRKWEGQEKEEKTREGRKDKRREKRQERGEVQGGIRLTKGLTNPLFFFLAPFVCSRARNGHRHLAQTSLVDPSPTKSTRSRDGIRSPLKAAKQQDEANSSSVSSAVCSLPRIKQPRRCDTLPPRRADQPFVRDKAIAVDLAKHEIESTKERTD
ncbi:hypothetical protein BKA67DRAFT_537084 [Truncatella angustata]|uniref:Uncharacterized protein n=1 Tax=Truncatella angustata TaxID=152316 RepID=A0A9P8ZWU4_9PEZI|nr:uncharacterized protein BKA67DRAFT_537084 [Truncatella angustata]KAH6653401.1 hypothetical protein BKA67DRAFT_537084 [Truncatella angustata]